MAPRGAGVGCDNGHAYPVREGYLDLFAGPADDETQRTLASFGYEWTVFDAVRPEDEVFWRWYFADVPLEELRGAVGLDAGCGKGRYTRFTAAHLAATVALDASDAVCAAARNLAELDGVQVVRADLRTAPFVESSFGFVSCLGVLHHLPDPEAAFSALARLVSPGGRILVYVYSRPGRRTLRGVGLALAAGIRAVTVHLPRPVVRTLSAPVAGLLYLGFVLPGAAGDRWRVRRLAALPLAVYRGRPVRSLWLDTHDRLTAPIEHRFVSADVAGWFDRAGLTVEACREQAGLFALGRRPAGIDEETRVRH